MPAVVEKSAGEPLTHKRDRVRLDRPGVGLIMLHRRHAPEGRYVSDGDRAAGGFALHLRLRNPAGVAIQLAFPSYDTDP
jgi:hypothetical protein